MDRESGSYAASSHVSLEFGIVDEIEIKLTLKEESIFEV